MNINSTLKNRYKIIQEIGKGGMSHVFLCEDLLLHTYWAGKCIIKDNTKESMQAYQALKKEAEILVSLQHKSIPKIIDHTDSITEFIVIMEFVRGISLYDWLQKNTPNERMILKWSMEILQILQYLHHEISPAIIFRDLKPENLLVDEHQCLCLIDFGIAIQMTHGKMESTPCYGTKGYASKEQSNPGFIDCRSDIYSFGATLFYMYTKSIYKGQRLPNVKLKKIMEKCLKADPDCRFQSVCEIMDELKYKKPQLSSFNSRHVIAITGVILCFISMISCYQYKKQSFALYNEYMLAEDYQKAIKVNEKDSKPYFYHYDQCKNQPGEKSDSLMFAIQEMQEVSLSSLTTQERDEIYIMMGFDCMDMNTSDFYRQAAVLFENVKKEDMTIYIQLSEFLALHERLSFDDLSKLKTLLNELENKADKQEYMKPSLQLYEIMNQIYAGHVDEFGIQIYEDVLRVSKKAMNMIERDSQFKDSLSVFIGYELKSHYYQANYYDTLGQEKSALKGYENFLNRHNHFVSQGYSIPLEISSKLNIVQIRFDILKEGDPL